MLAMKIIIINYFESKMFKWVQIDIRPDVNNSKQTLHSWSLEPFLNFISYWKWQRFLRKRRAGRQFVSHAYEYGRRSTIRSDEGKTQPNARCAPPRQRLKASLLRRRASSQPRWTWSTWEFFRHAVKRYIDRPQILFSDSNLYVSCFNISVHSTYRVSIKPVWR